MLNPEAVIHLSENRKHFQNDTFRRFETNLISLTESSILKCSDNTLSAQNSQQILADNFVLIVLLPLVGAIEIKKGETSIIINSGEIAHIYCKKEDEIAINNPYENDLVNYLEIWIDSDKILEDKIVSNDFDLDKNKNCLVEISNIHFSEKIFVGKFDGRKEGKLFVENRAFIFVINGVFECQNRLLESRSALSLWNAEDLEFEGLGRENIILIVSNQRIS
jgi:quercetin 2,3-dioxygenase